MMAQTTLVDITIVWVNEVSNNLVIVRPGGQTTNVSPPGNSTNKGLTEYGKIIQSIDECLYQEGEEVKNTHSSSATVTCHYDET